MCVFTALHSPKETLSCCGSVCSLQGCECVPHACVLVATEGPGARVPAASARPRLVSVGTPRPTCKHLSRTRPLPWSFPGVTSHSSFPSHAGPAGLSPLLGVLERAVVQDEVGRQAPCTAGHVPEALWGVSVPQPEAKEVSWLAQDHVGGQQ